MILRITHIVILVAFCLFVADLSAQVQSNNGLFSLPEGSGCAPYGANGEFVFDTNGVCDGSIACAIDFNFDGTFDTDPNFPVVLDNTPIFYTYSTPGTYRIMIIFGAGGPNDELTFTIYPSTAPDFNVYVCSGNEVQVEITDTDFADYQIDYDNDNIFETTSSGGFVPPHSYGVAGQQVISVKGNYTNCGQASKTVVTTPVFPAGESIFRLQALSPTEIELTISGSANDNILYQLDRTVNNTSSNEVMKFTNAGSLTDIDINADQNFYCYRVGAIDICNNPVPNFTNTVCSVKPSLVIDNGSNDASWETNAAGSTSLNIIRNGVPLSLPVSSTGTYPDTDVTCGTEYCYQYIMLYGFVESISHVVCGTAINSTTEPPAVNEITTIVNGDVVEMEWLPLANHTISKYDLFKIPDIYIPEVSTDIPSYVDNNGYNTTEGNCYQIRFDDVCGQRSALSSTTCTLHLAATLDEPTNAVNLTWQPYVGYGSGVNRYVVEKFNEAGDKVDEFDAGTLTNYVDSSPAEGQIFSYRVKAFSNSIEMTSASVSNFVQITLSPRLWFPSAFIPGGSDPANQTFSVKGSQEHIAEYELRIFNRWGELIFFSTDMNNGWDGTYQGVRMPEGSYVFRTKVIDHAGRTFDYSGAVILFRKS